MKKTLLLTAFIAMIVLSPASAASLSVSPSHPTAADKITFTIIIPNWDCCTRYTWDSTAVAAMGDTALLLTYQYNLPQVCPMIACLDVDKLLRYNSAPLRTGTYAVYELRELLCTTQICPDIAFMPVKIGSVTVTTSAGVVNRLHRAPIAANAGTSASGKMYDVRGILVSSSTTHAVLRAPGVYLVKNGSQMSRTIVAP